VCRWRLEVPSSLSSSSRLPLRLPGVTSDGRSSSCYRCRRRCRGSYFRTRALLELAIFSSPSSPFDLQELLVVRVKTGYLRRQTTYLSYLLHLLVCALAENITVVAGARGNATSPPTTSPCCTSSARATALVDAPPAPDVRSERSLHQICASLRVPSAFGCAIHPSRLSERSDASRRLDPHQDARAGTGSTPTCPQGGVVVVGGGGGPSSTSPLP
jgi:hypothetical protein